MLLDVVVVEAEVGGYVGRPWSAAGGWAVRWHFARVKASGRGWRGKYSRAVVWGGEEHHQHIYNRVYMGDVSIICVLLLLSSMSLSMMSWMAESPNR